MAPSRHDWKIVDWDIKPQHNQPTNPHRFQTDQQTEYRNNPKFSDEPVRANYTQIRLLLVWSESTLFAIFHLHLLDALHYGRAILFKF